MDDAGSGKATAGSSGAPIPLAKAFRVLQRAAEFDVRGQSLTVSELRRMADDVQIERESVETAIKEVLTAKGRKSGHLPAFERRSLLFSAGVGVAMGFATALPSVFALPGIVAAVLYLAICAVTCMQSRAVLRYQVVNAVVWTAGALAALPHESNVAQDVALATFLNWVITAIVGGLMIAFGKRKKG